MKKITFLLLIMTWFSNAQIVDIPDANFKAALIAQGVDTNTDGDIQESEAEVVTVLNILESNISDLTGIEAFSSLINLNCRTNQLTSLNVTQNVNLESLSCSENLISSLDLSQNLNLDFLSCRANQIVTLDLSQNPNLTSIIADNNQLTSINTTQNLVLDTLWCNDNQLTNLDITQNTNLINLLCDTNALTSLDTSQNLALESLICYTNQLTSLDLSQNTALQSLRCFDNQLSTLDASNNSNLTTLLCQQNELVDLFIKNGSTETLLNFGNNANLIYICADDDQVESVQAQADLTTVVSSYCSFTPGGDYNTISGNIIYDLNGNGCDAIDVPQPHIKIDLNDGTNQGSGFSKNDGSYTFYTEAGNFDITPNLENPTWFNVSPTTVSIPFPDDNNNTATQDFCITANGTHNDVEIAIAPIDFARPGFDVLYQIVYNNIGNQTLSGDFELLFEDDVLDFVSATVAPDTQATGMLSWNYTDLLPFENRSVYVTLNVNSPTETPPVNIDDALSFIANINPIAGDENVNNNNFQYKQIVVGSYDPNNITCLQGSILPTSDIGENLHYVVNFENIGTFEAENVVIEIDIDPLKFDSNTLQVLNASHAVVTRIEENRLKFIFEDIYLSASGGHGNILLRIRTKDNIQPSEPVTKKANIHFDYNFPIETNEANTVFTNLSVNDFQLDSSIRIYPNPAKDLVSISAHSNIKSIAVYDIQGRIILISLVNLSETTIDISNVNNGIYLFKINTEKGSVIEKVIKE